MSKSSNLRPDKTGKFSLTVAQKLVGIIFLMVVMLGTVAGAGT